MKFLLWKFSVFDFMTVNTEEYLRQEFKLSLDRESSIFWVTCNSIAPLHESKSLIKNLKKLRKFAIMSEELEL